MRRQAPRALPVPRLPSPVQLFARPYITSRTAVHRPRMKSGNFTGALPFATDISLSGPGADHAAAS